MRKLILILLALVLCVGSLSGCKAEEVTAPHTYEDLTIHIPVDFIDLTGEAFAGDLTFIFGRDPISVNGIREEKALFRAYGLELSLESYTDLLLKSNRVSAKPEQKDGIYTYSYEAVSDGVSYTYVVTLWETGDAFWTVQAYCPTENYSQVKKDMWNILRSVTV